MCTMYGMIDSVFDSSEFYNIFRPDSYYVLKSAIPLGILYALNIAKFYAHCLYCLLSLNIIIWCMSLFTYVLLNIIHCDAHLHCLI